MAWERVPSPIMVELYPESCILVEFYLVEM